MADAITKDQLLQNLRDGEKEALALLAGIPPEKFEEGRYESGWNGRQILAHITAIEWTYPRLIDLAQGKIQPKKNPDPKPAAAPTAAFSGGVDDYNNRSISRYADASVGELLEKWREFRATTIATIEVTDADVFLKPVKSAGGIQGPLGTVLNMVAYMHVQTHVADIAGSQA